MNKKWPCLLHANKKPSFTPNVIYKLGAFVDTRFLALKKGVGDEPYCRMVCTHLLHHILLFTDDIHAFGQRFQGGIYVGSVPQCLSVYRIYGQALG